VFPLPPAFRLQLLHYFFGLDAATARVTKPET